MPSRPPKLLVLALDIGSSSTRSALFDEKRRALPLTAVSRQYAIRYTPDAGAELDPHCLLRAARACVGETLRGRHETKYLQKIPIAAVSSSAFWHSLLGLDRRRKPITPIWTWADARAARDAEALRDRIDEREVLQRTGCMVRAAFWPAKLRWIRRTQPKLFKRVRYWVSPADWIFRELFGANCLSHSIASATGLYDLRRHRWDNELCDLCALKIGQLGGIRDIADVEKPRANFTEAAIFGAIGDGAAGNLGSGADADGFVAINIGTSAAVRVMESAKRPRLPSGLFRFVVDERRTLFGGAVSNAGNLHRWCLRELRLTPGGADREANSSALAAADPIVALPFWVPERAPTWPNDLRGVLTGLSQATRASDIVRATTTSVFYRLAQILELIESAAGPQQAIIVSGGIVSSSPASLHLLADSLGRDVRVAAEPEASLRGAAVYALEKLGCVSVRPTTGRTVRANQALAAKHRARREQQIELEGLLEGA